MLTDARVALRQLLKSPGFALVAVLSLAFGIGLNTAIFSLVNEFLLRSLPVRNPDQLVLFRTLENTGVSLARGSDGNGYSQRDPVTGRWPNPSFSLVMFERFRAHHPGLEDVFAFSPIDNPNLLIDGQPEVSPSAQLVSGNYYASLGVSAVIGRTLNPDDDQPGAAPVAVLSYRYWRNRFAGDPGVLGKTILVNQVPTSVVGVTGRGFDGAMQAGTTVDISVPLAHHLRFMPDRAYHAQPWYWWVRIMGRLSPGATAAEARAALEPLFRETAREGWLAGVSRDSAPRAMPEAPIFALERGAQGETDARRLYAKSLHLLLGLAGLVLISACANLANLLLARGTARRREIAVRIALGASRGRIVRQLLTESLLLASLGAALGTLLAYGGRGLLQALHPFGGGDIVLDLPLDARVLGFTIAMAVTTAVLSGLAPALRVTRVDLGTEFQGGARTVGAGTRSGFSRALMVVQIALSLVLLVSTGLFVRTLCNLQAVDTGFNRQSLVLFRLDAGSAGYKRAELADLYVRLQQRLESVPGVRAATFSGFPLLSRNVQRNGVSVPGAPALEKASDGKNNVSMNNVAANYFATTGLPLVLGREFTARDDGAAPRVGIINQSLAAKCFGHENPVGRQLEITSGPRGLVEIVGVVRDARYTDLRSPMPPTLYLATFQQLGGPIHFTLRINGSPGAVLASIRAAVREIAPGAPVLDLRTLAEQIDRLNAQELLFARLSGFFGTLALVLACMGLYGLLSWQVLRRTSEIGLRMALGALPAQVVRMFLREALVLVGLGVAIGIAIACLASRLITSLLFGLSPSDPLTYGIVASSLTAVALAASVLPALRAAKVDPIQALRTE